MAIDPLHERQSLFARMRVDTRPFRHRDFRNLWLGQAISTVGGEIGVVAVPYQVYTLALPKFLAYDGRAHEPRP